MASIIFNGPSSHTFDATVDDVITASAVVANNGDRTGYARMAIEGSPSGRSDLMTVPPNSTVTVSATATIQAFMENTRRTLTARLFEMTANNETIRVLGEHTQAVAQIAALKAAVKPPVQPGEPVRMYNLAGESMMVPADQVDHYLTLGFLLEPPIETEVIVTTDGSVEMFRDGESVMVAANLVEYMKGAGWSLDPEEEIETIINGKPVVTTIATTIATPIVTTPVLTTAFDSVNLTELQELGEGGFFVDAPAPRIDTVELTELEKIEEGSFFVDAPVIEKEEITYSWDDIYITPAPPPPEEITYSWDDIYVTPVKEDYVFFVDAVDTSTMAGVIAASDRESPYYGITREDVLAGIFGEEEEEEGITYEMDVAPPEVEVFEYGSYQPAPTPVELAPIFVPEPVQVDTFQETHDYFESIGAFDPVYEEVVIYEEDDGYVWLDPTPTTYEVDYWYGEG